MITNHDIKNCFDYHKPDDFQMASYKAIRIAGKDLAEAILDNCPASADTTAAIRKVREAVMTANAAIACGGK